MPIINLDSAPVSLQAVRDKQREELFGILDTIEGRKTLIIEPYIEPCLSLILERQELKEFGVDVVMKLSADFPSRATRSIVYLVRPTVPSLRTISRHILSRRYGDSTYAFHAIFIPRELSNVQRIMNGVDDGNAYGDIASYTHSLALNWFPLETDTVSMELHRPLLTTLVESDYSHVHAMAHGLMSLQCTFGTVPRIRGKGELSQRIARAFLKMRGEYEGDLARVTTLPEVKQIILLDRTTDLVTPLLTPLTYEGMLHEFFTVERAQLCVPKAVLGSSEPGETRYPLSSLDALFPELRDLNIGAVLPRLAAEGKKIREIYDARKGLEKESISKVSSYIQKLTDSRARENLIKLHLKIMDRLKELTRTREFCEQLDLEFDLVAGTLKTAALNAVVRTLQLRVALQEPLARVLRLFALICLTQGGLPRKQLETLKREIAQAYGFHHMFTLMNMERAGLIFERGPQGRWFEKFRKKFGIFDPECDAAADAPSSMAYVHNFYAPISCRFVEYCLFGAPGRRGRDAFFPPDRPGKSAQNTLLQLLPGPYFDYAQDTKRADLALGSSTALVVFVGGVTPAEVSALRFLTASEAAANTDIVIATTGVVSGRTFVEEFHETVTRGSAFPQAPGTTPGKYKEVVARADEMATRTIRIDG
eukprot:gnl/Chilomastix_cuspidata/1595.p1 GENE.gnl/Chilomastix_cuspidata/1595~~gnl/Chilomastix_cuspidata/1595.p1  ORF type:complete len:650 (+),score=375.00 gnl/Chilomastix_cuspidata/1595:422-2371(+)